MTSKTFAALHPELLSYWSSNNSEKPDSISPMSAKKVEWACPVSSLHVWIKSVSEMVRHPKCPHCLVVAKNGTVPGENDVATLYPELALLYDSDKNTYPLSYYTSLSRTTVFWLDSDEKISILEKVKSYRRSKESVNVEGRVLSVTRGPLSETHPHIASMLCDENISANQVSFGSNRKVQWQCVNGHKWSDSSKNMVKRDGECPYCSQKKVLPGFNDLSTTHPEIASTLKAPALGETLKANSYRKVDWVCKEGHEWAARVEKRVAGSGCPYCLNKKVLPGFNDLASANPAVISVWHSDNKLSPQEVIAGSETIVVLVCENDPAHKIETMAYTLIRSPLRARYICRSCPNSGPEAELVDYVSSLGFEVVKNDRTILGGKELDIYLPSKKVAIEFNGLYWHSEASGKDKFSHYNKWLACKNQGIQLIQIWEDDWVSKRSLVEKMIAYKIGATSTTKVYARQTKVSVVSKEEADSFLEENHIQGTVDGSIRLGLYSSQALVALIVLKREPSAAIETLNLLRFATSTQVVGGFTKLLKAVTTGYPNVSQIITFSDNTLSDGNLYDSNGFISDKEVPPDYMYIVKGVRVHKFNFRLKRFRNDPSLIFKEGLSETDLAHLNGLNRIWDAGKVRWVYPV